MPDMQINRLVIIVIEEVCAPVPLHASGIERIKHALQSRIRNRTGKINRRRTKFPNGFERGFRLCQITRITPYDRTHFLQVILFREWGNRRYGRKSKPAVDVLRSAEDKILPETEQIGRVLQRPKHWSSINGLYWIRPEQERGDDAKVPTAASHCPEEISILVTICCHTTPVSQNHVNAEQVINRQSIMASEVTCATSECQPTYPCTRKNAAWHSQAELMCGVINISPNAATLHAHCAVRWINMDPTHLR